MVKSYWQYLIALSIPIINVLADSTQGYSNQGITSPGYLRAFLILFFVLINIKVLLAKNRINMIILFSLIYYFILGCFTSDFLYSQSVFLKYMIGALMFPIGYYYFNTIDRFKSLVKIMIATLGIYSVFLIIANIFGLGTSDYLEDSVYFGSGRVNATKAMMILLIISPLSLRFSEKKSTRIVYLTIIVIAIVFVLLGIKRSAILGLSVGIIVYLILTPYKSKLIKSIIGIGIILLISSPLYYEFIEKRFEARVDAGRFDVTQAENEEGRIIELRQVLEEFKSGSLSYQIFGAEFFNNMKLFNTDRMLHTDYANMFSGTGLLGFVLFIYIYYLIFKRSLYLRKIFKGNRRNQDIVSISIALVFALMITGISGTVTVVGIRSIAFMFWGASFSLLENELILKRRNFNVKQV